MEQQYILGIDQGSTGSKVIVVDKSGEIVRKAYRRIESFFPQDGWLEHDADNIWNSVKDCLLEIAESFDLSQVCAIGITNQRETTILWDKATGRPLLSAISWQCTRSQRNHRADQQSLLFCQQDRMGAGKRGRSARALRTGRGALRQRQHLDPLESDRRKISYDRFVQRRTDHGFRRTEK